MFGTNGSIHDAGCTLLATALCAVKNPCSSAPCKVADETLQEKYLFFCRTEELVLQVIVQRLVPSLARVPQAIRVPIVQQSRVSCTYLTFLKKTLFPAFSYQAQLYSSARYCFHMSIDNQGKTQANALAYCQAGGADMLAVIESSDADIAIHSTPFISFLHT